MKIEIEVTSCSDCPSLKWGSTFGNDGRDGVKVCYCEQGAFGEKSCPKEMGATNGRNIVPSVPPLGCPYFNSTPLERVADRLGISSSTLQDILNEEKCFLNNVN